MNDPSFHIQYNGNSKPVKARLTTLCTPAELSLGLKDICLYLRNYPDLADTQPEKSIQLYISWEKNQSDLRQPDGEEIKLKLEQIKQELQNALLIDNRMKTDNFILSDLIKECDQLILDIQIQGVEKTTCESGKKLAYLLNDIGERLMIQNKLYVRSSLLKTAEIQQAMQQIYNDIPFKIKKHFDYTIDFESLTFDKQ